MWKHDLIDVASLREELPVPLVKRDRHDLRVKRGRQNLREMGAIAPLSPVTHTV